MVANRLRSYVRNNGEELHAGTKHHKTSQKAATRRQESYDPSRRIRPRGDPSRSRREAWSPIRQAGNRNRPIQGSTGWGETAASKKRPHLGTHASTRKTRLRERAVESWAQEV